MDSPPPVPLWSPTPEEFRELWEAKTLLENPGLAARLANTIGSPIEKGFRMLPAGWSNVVHRATQTALTRALKVAIATLDTRQPRKRSSEQFHRLLVGASGGLGGAFGLAALPVELPLSTTLMLRSIADIARSEGHDLRSVPIRLSCLEVFALGGRAASDNAAESSYWVVRAALAKAVTEAAAYLGERGLVEQAAPAVVRLIGAIASRFGVIVSEQLAAKAVPIIGAAGGATVNVLFMNHFQDMARGHFIVKRLEAKYGSENVERVYRTLAIPMK
jgi:hypothetical protein